jgi:hypothetical protein
VGEGGALQLEDRPLARAEGNGGSGNRPSGVDPVTWNQF